MHSSETQSCQSTEASQSAQKLVSDILKLLDRSPKLSNSVVRLLLTVILLLASDGSQQVLGSTRPQASEPTSPTEPNFLCTDSSESSNRTNLEKLLAELAAQPQNGMFFNLSVLEIQALHSLLDQGILPTQNEVTAAASELMAPQAQANAPEEVCASDYFVRNWSGESLYQPYPHFNSIEPERFNIVTVDLFGQVFVIAFSKDAYDNFANLSDGRTFQEALQAALRQIFESSARAATLHGLALDFNNQSEVAGGTIWFRPMADESDPNIVGFVEPHRQSKANSADNQRGVIQTPIPSQMILTLSGFADLLRNLNPEMQALAAKAPKDMTPDEFIRYLLTGYSWVLEHELEHNFQFASRIIKAFTHAESGTVLLRDSGLVENMAVVKEIFGHLEAIERAGRNDAEIIPAKEVAMMFFAARYLEGAFGCVDSKCGTFYMTEHSPNAYSHGFLSLQLLMQTAGGNYDNFNYSLLQDMLGLGHHLNTVPMQYRNGNPFDDYFIDYFKRYMEEVFPDMEFTTEQFHSWTIESLYRVVRFQKIRTELLKQGVSDHEAFSQALNTVGIRNTMDFYLLAGSTPLESSYGTPIWKNAAIDINLPGTTSYTLTGDFYNGQGRILDIKSSCTWAANTNDPAATVMIGRGDTLTKLEDGAYLAPGDMVFVVLNRSSPVDYTTDPPTKHPTTIGTFTGVPLAHSVYIPNLGSHRAVGLTRSESSADSGNTMNASAQSTATEMLGTASMTLRSLPSEQRLSALTDLLDNLEMVYSTAQEWVR